MTSPDEELNYILHTEQAEANVETLWFTQFVFFSFFFFFTDVSYTWNNSVYNMHNKILLRTVR
jgi:hypothetical protein